MSQVSVPPPSRWSIRSIFLIALCVCIVGVWAWASFIPLSRPGPVVIEPTDRAAERKREREDLRAQEAEIERRQSALLKEIAPLYMEHPWAGRYYAGDGLGVNIDLLIAPKGGCLAVWRGCLGLYGCNWGSVAVRDDRLHVEFERPNTPGEWGHFDCDYTIVGCGEDRFLKPPGGRDELRPTEP